MTALNGTALKARSAALFPDNITGDISAEDKRDYDIDVVDSLFNILTAGQIASLGLKGSPVAADHIFINDSEDSNSVKRITFDSIPAGPQGDAGTDGASFLSGIVAPTTEGVNGDSYVDTVTGLTYTKSGGSWSLDGGDLTGPQGDQGDQGDAGTNGTDGASFLSGIVAPTTEGVNGDSYVDTVTGLTYTKSGGTWSLDGGDLTGPQGIQGIQGNAGTNGTNGASFLSGIVAPTTEGVNGDSYVDTVTGLTYTKSGGTWSLDGGDLTGPTGSQGIQGVTGDDGSNFLSGIVAPTTEGVNGDTYLDTVTGLTYIKSGGSWALDGGDLTGPAGAGETNTASNAGTGGIGVFDNKDGVDLEFRNIIAENSKVTIALDAGNKEIDIGVDEDNFVRSFQDPAGSGTDTSADRFLQSTRVAAGVTLAMHIEYFAAFGTTQLPIAGLFDIKDTANLGSSHGVALVGRAISEVGSTSTKLLYGLEAKVLQNGENIGNRAFFLTYEKRNDTAVGNSNEIVLCTAFADLKNAAGTVDDNTGTVIGIDFRSAGNGGNERIIMYGSATDQLIAGKTLSVYGTAATIMAEASIGGRNLYFGHDDTKGIIQQSDTNQDLSIWVGRYMVIEDGLGLVPRVEGNDLGINGFRWQIFMTDMNMKHQTAPSNPVSGSAVIYVTSANEVHLLDPSGVNKTLTNTVDPSQYTGQQNFAEATLSDGANISWNLNTQQTATVTLAGNRTLDNPTNLVAGGTYLIRVVQDGTGSRTLAYGTAYKFPGGTDPVLTTGSGGAVDLLTFYCDGTNMLGVFTGDFS